MKSRSKRQYESLEIANSLHDSKTRSNNLLESPLFVFKI